MAFRFDLPDIDDAYALSDWIEVMMLLSRKSQISRAELSEALSANIGSTPQELETPINFLYSEIARRRRVAGNGYPLIVEDTIIKLDSNSNSEFYKFLLLISLDGPMRKKRKFKDIDEIFDNVVMAAMKAYWGNGTEAIRFGWPPSGDRPKTFKAALEWLATLIGLPLGNGSSSPATKDGGVDVVVWKPFADNMTAFIVAYVQCTVQADWFPKGRDVIDRIWYSRIDTGGWALTSLAIPFVIPKNYEKWDDLRRTVTLVFDRLRLTQMLRDSDSTAFKKMLKWSKKEISKYSLGI